jgi:hypothetical protein
MRIRGVKVKPISWHLDWRPAKFAPNRHAERVSASYFFYIPQIKILNQVQDDA